MEFHLNPQGGCFQFELELLVFAEGGKPEYPEKNPRSSDENQQQTQPTYDMFGNRTRVALVGGCVANAQPLCHPCSQLA